MPTENDYLKKIYCFMRYAILLAWVFVIFNLADLHTGMCKSIAEIPLAGFVCIFSWVFGYGLKQVMVIAAIASIGLMAATKKVDYLLLILLIVSFADAFFQGFLRF